MEAGISRSKRVVIGDAGHWMYGERPAEFSPQVIGFIELNRIASEVDEAILLRGFWVAQRFSAAIGGSSGLGLQPLKFYQRQHAEG
jgi:hypothetical protein